MKSKIDVAFGKNQTTATTTRTTTTTMHLYISWIIVTCVASTSYLSAFRLLISTSKLSLNKHLPVKRLQRKH